MFGHNSHLPRGYIRSLMWSQISTRQSWTHSHTCTLYFTQRIETFKRSKALFAIMISTHALYVRDLRCSKDAHISLTIIRTPLEKKKQKNLKRKDKDVQNSRRECIMWKEMFVEDEQAIIYLISDMGSEFYLM